MNTIICTFTSLGADDKILSYNNLKLNIIRGVQHGKPIRKRHSKVKNEVNMVHIFWLSPLPIFTILHPQLKIQNITLALLLGILWAISFGPLYSNE